MNQLILNKLNEHGVIDNTNLVLDNGVALNQEHLRSTLKSLLSKEMIEYTANDTEWWILTSEGKEIALLGSHEVKVFNAIPSTGISIMELNVTLNQLIICIQNKTIIGQHSSIGQGKAFKNKWIRKIGDRIERIVDIVIDTAQIDLQSIQSTGTGADSILKEFKKRQLVEKSKRTHYTVRKGSKFSTVIIKEETDITSEMLMSGAWKTSSFKKYNFEALGAVPDSGHLHPLMKVREEFRQIFFDMGFTEMPTNQFIESSFWNFDTLFQPQQHPARDMHDTFFLKDPQVCRGFPEDYAKRVCDMHSKGGNGSIGYGYDWQLAEAEKLILRTHTTAVSSLMLYKLAQEPIFRPVKYFSIDRVFRNEALDATHLAEFHQIEGLIADHGLTLGDLIGTLHNFFQKLGIKDIKFKPAYNPYTEPSMEIFSYHSGLDKWVEIGNSGMFRPEMLGPLGLPEGVRVIAWGLSLERPTMIKYGIDNIRELLGHKVDLDMVMNNPICRFQYIL